MLVSKGSVRGSTHSTFVAQLGGHSKTAVFWRRVLAALFALLPGLPFVPFAVLSSGGRGAARSWSARVEQRRAQKSPRRRPRSEENVGGSRDEPLADLMRVDEIRIELGMGLVPLTTAPEGGADGKRSVSCGAPSPSISVFVLPAVRIKDNIDLSAGEYALQVLGVEIARENDGDRPACWRSLPAGSRCRSTAPKRSSHRFAFRRAGSSNGNAPMPRASA